MNLLAKGTRTLSRRESVPPKAAGEGLRSTARFGGALPYSFDSRICGSRRPRLRDIRGAPNFLHHPVKPFPDFIVAKPKFDETMTFDGSAARRIARDSIEMLFAINFDRQPEVMAAEICNKSSDWYLSMKLEPVAATTTKLLPKQIFGRRASCPQTSRNSGQPVSHALKCEDDFSRSQPLTRRLRRHPLPQGEGQRSGVRS